MKESDIVICGHGSGRPSYKNLQEYLEKRHTQYMSNGIDKGIACVRRLKEIDDAGRERFKIAYNIIIGRNEYSQDLREFVFVTYKGTYYSDCSSSICACLRKVGYIDVGFFNTEEMYKSSLFEDVPVVIENGHIMNPEILRPADILLFRGNISRPAFIGHVEAVYSIPDTEDSGALEVEVDMKKFKLRTIEIKDGKGMQGGDVLLMQEILNERGFYGRDGKPLKLDGDTGNNYETSNTMFAVKNYIDARNAAGADLGDNTGWGPRCWGDQNLPPA